jgi:hypothetical protein
VQNKFKFPDLKEQQIVNNHKIIKIYIDSKTNSINDLNKKDNAKNISNTNNTTKKNNMSNISTNANISLSNNSYKFSKLNKYTSSSVDFNYNNNNNSYLDINKNRNNSNNTLNDNSFEQRFKTQNSDNTLSFFANRLNRNNKYNNRNNLFLSKSNSNITTVNDNNNNKVFISNLNPIYTLLRKELLSEFHKKTKNI